MKTETLHGLWQDEAGRFFYLDEDGTLGLPRRSDDAGLSWFFDGTALTLITLDAPGSSTKEHRFVLQKKGLFSVHFLDEAGQPVTWKKSFKNVGRLEGSLFYRERMMLPPDVIISAQLLPLHGNTLASQIIMPAEGHGELCFRLYYLASDVEENARLTASISYGEEPLFSTPDNEIISMDSRPAVLLHHSVPNRENPSLKGTHWRLKELDGKEAQHFTDQPEVHLILQDEGQATGSDGCNNFFMSWEEDGEKITFTSGGATLRLCPQGEEQARSLYQMFQNTDSWKINGSNLELYSSGKKSAVFRAVKM